MELKHYPRPDEGETFLFDRTRRYGQTERYDKPSGFWVSVAGPDDWKSWTQSEDFCAGSTVSGNEYSVRLAESANMLTLGSALEVLAFGDEYGRPSSSTFSDGDRTYRIDWPRLAGEYDGIIAPYQWECRYDHRTFWYYTWDCASGCIWNLDAIADVVAPEQAVVDGVAC